MLHPSHCVSFAQLEQGGFRCGVQQDFDAETTEMPRLISINATMQRCFSFELPASIHACSTTDRDHTAMHALHQRRHSPGCPATCIGLAGEAASPPPRSAQRLWLTRRSGTPCGARSDCYSALRRLSCQGLTWQPLLACRQGAAMVQRLHGAWRDRHACMHACMVHGDGGGEGSMP